MSEEIVYPDLMSPPFWGDSDTLVYNSTKLGLESESIDARGIYSFFPIIRDGSVLTLLDPYDPTRELLSYSFKDEFKRYATFFRDDTDIMAISAYTLGFTPPKDDLEITFGKLSNLITQEIKRGLTLPSNRGKSIGLSNELFNEEGVIESLSQLMSVESRFGVDIESELHLIRVSMLFHNVRP